MKLINFFFAVFPDSVAHSHVRSFLKANTNCEFN